MRASTRSRAWPEAARSRPSPAPMRASCWAASDPSQDIPVYLRSVAGPRRSGAVLPAEVATVACRAFVRVESGFYMGLEWPLDRASTVIGRGTGGDRVLHEATISRAHALLAFRGDKVFVQALGSTNGTLVNGVSSQQVDLKQADELKMGRLVLRIRMAEEGAGG